MNPSPNRRIVVQTYEGYDLENHIDADPTENFIRLARSGYDTLWDFKRLSSPTGRYNCHGLVFACRRTNIREDDHIRKCLTDDCYRQTNSPQCGDIVVYRDGRNAITHTSLVVEIRKLSPDSVPIIYVWGKWGADSEYVHHVNHCPFTMSNHTVEYWRLSNAQHAN